MQDAATIIKGTVKRISGPIVHAAGLGGAGLFDLVEVGNKRLTGEIVRLEKDEAVVQVYEDATGMNCGEEARSLGRPLSMRLGPGLIGTIYDGIQRPLEALYKQDGVFLKIGARGEPLDKEKKWRFVPNAALAAALSKDGSVAVHAGTELGSVRETESVVCKIMVPPSASNPSGVASGKLSFLAA